MSLTTEKAIKNRGVERNKKPLQNIIYKIEVNQIKDDAAEYYGRESNPLGRGWKSRRWPFAFHSMFSIPDGARTRNLQSESLTS